MVADYNTTPDQWGPHTARPLMSFASPLCRQNKLLFLKNINPFGSFKKNTYFCAP